MKARLLLLWGVAGVLRGAQAAGLLQSAARRVRASTSLALTKPKNGSRRAAGNYRPAACAPQSAPTTPRSIPAILPYLLLLAFLQVVSSASAAPVDDFATANAAFDAGKYPEAIQQYEKLLRQGQDRAELYFNLGNAFERTDKLPRAALSYERALLLDPSLAAARTNLAAVRGRLAASDPAPWWTRLPSAGASVSVIVGTGALWLLLLSLVARWRRLGGTVNFWTFLAVLSGLTVLLAGAGFWFHDRPLISPSRAVVLEADKLRTIFSDRGAVLTNVNPGAIVEVISDNGHWSNCRLPDGTQGWLHRESVERIVPRPAS